MNAAPTTPPSPMMPNAAVIGSSALLEHKTCIKCGQSKPLSEYYHQGRDGACKPCYCQQTMDWMRRNPAKAKTIKRRYQKSPKGRAAASKDNRLTRQRHPEKVAAAKKAAYQKNRPKYIKRCTENTLRYIREAAPCYVRRLLALGTPLTPAALPESLVKAKQQQLKLKRTICNLQKT